MRRVWMVVGLIMAVLLAGSATVLARGHRPRHEQAGAHAPRHRGRPVGRRHHKHSRHHKHRRHRRHRPKKPAPTRPPAPTAPTPPVAPVAPIPAPGPCPSGPAGSTQSVGATTYALEGTDTFTKDAPLGSFAQTTNNQIVYTGDHGMSWTGYGDNWTSTYSGGAEGYQPSTVLSVHDGMLDFHLHNDTRGNPVGADPSPLPGGNRYQTYGVWSFCEKLAPADSHNLSDFYQAPLLWPPNDADGPSAESDFPEGNLAASDLSGFSHYGGSGSQDAFPIGDVIPSFTADQWHVYTQAWGPGFRSYYVDGQLVGTSTHQVWSGPERWQLQVEPSGTNDGDSGDVFVKWVWIGTPTS
jgi:hypothetical protein